MKKVYVYLLDDMAECEIGYILQAFSMEKLLKNGTKEFEVKTVSFNKEPVLTLGGLTIVPDYTISEVDFNASTALLLPGSSTWGSKENQEILEKAQECLNKNILVGAICGATLALADYGILDKFKHTSNSLEYLNFFSKNYAGQSSYVCSNSVLDRNLVTASSAGSLEWTKNILKSLNVYSDKKITAFYNYYSTGNVKYYDELLFQKHNPFPERPIRPRKLVILSFRKRIANVLHVHETFIGTIQVQGQRPSFFVFSRHYRDHEGFARSKEHIHLKLIGHQVVNYIHAVQQEMPNPNRSSTGIHQTKPIIFNLI